MEHSPEQDTAQAQQIWSPDPPSPDNHLALHAPSMQTGSAMDQPVGNIVCSGRTATTSVPDLERKKQLCGCVRVLSYTCLSHPPLS